MANTFRIGCIGHLNKKDMYQAIDAVKKTLKELDIKLNWDYQRHKNKKTTILE